MKTIKSNIKAEHQAFDSQQTIILYIQDNDIRDVCLILLLLNESLTDKIEWKLENFSIFLKLSKTNSSTYSIFDKKKKTLKGDISKNSLEYMLHFLLKLYRDGFAEADHIDIDFENKEGQLITLIIKVDSYREYSPEQLNKLLGID